MAFPFEGAGFWPLVSMGAILGGTMRSPLTGVIFALELTHDVNMLLPLLVAATMAHAFTVLTLRRSILTEKVSRRGFHLSREYATDPLEILFVREVMRPRAAALRADLSLAELPGWLHADPAGRGQRLYPVVDEDGRLAGLATRTDLLSLADRAARSDGEPRLADAIRTAAIVAYPDESLRAVVHRMADTGLTRFPVVERGADRRLVGMVSLTDLLQARTRNLEAERRRERVLGLHVLAPSPRRGTATAPPA
jgi:CBS-domain-containing membrane protein